MIERSGRAHLGLIAAGVAFFGLLAAFPALAAVVALWGLFADPGLVAEELEQLREFLPPEAFEILAGQVKALVAVPADRIGWTTALTLAAALWSTRAGVAALIQGFNAAHGVPNRSGLGHQATALILTLVLVAVALSMLAAGVIVPLVFTFVALGPLEGWTVTALRWTVLPLIAILGLGIVCRWGPNVPARRHRGFRSPGLWLAVVLWIGASEGFALYLANFPTYSAVYGSIGAVVALLMWLYLSAYAVLLGAALDAVLAENQ